MLFSIDYEWSSNCCYIYIKWVNAHKSYGSIVIYSLAGLYVPLMRSANLSCGFFILSTEAKRAIDDRRWHVLSRQMIHEEEINEQ